MMAEVLDATLARAHKVRRVVAGTSGAKCPTAKYSIFDVGLQFGIFTIVGFVFTPSPFCFY